MSKADDDDLAESERVLRELADGGDGGAINISAELDRLRAALAKAECDRDKSQENYQFMVNRAADEHLDGYRELAAKVCSAEESQDDLRSEVTRLRELCGKASEFVGRQRRDAADVRAELIAAAKGEKPDAT